MMNENPEEDEYEEEEIFVYADLESILPSDELIEPNTSIKIIGIDSENPVMQINNKIFKGTYDYPIGTNIFFCEDADYQQTDMIFSSNPEKYYKYYTDTNKVLCMKRIFIQPLEEPLTEVKIETEEEKVNRLVIKKTYEEALNQFLKNNEEQPRKIDPSEKFTVRILNKIIYDKDEDNSSSDGTKEADEDPNDADYVPDSSIAD